MNDINWDDAPEGATHISEAGCFYKIDKRGSNDYCFCSNEKWVPCALSTDFVGALMFKSESKPVYTQAMCDAGTLPLVGMEFTLRFHGNDSDQVVVMVVTTDEYIIVKIGDGEQHYYRSSYSMLPIDTRTDSDKAIDDIKKIGQWDDADFNCSLLDAIKFGKIHNVKWGKS